MHNSKYRPEEFNNVDKVTKYRDDPTLGILKSFNECKLTVKFQPQ